MTGLLQFSCQSFILKNIIEPKKSGLNQLQLADMSHALYPIFPHIIPLITLHGSSKWLRTERDMTKYILHKYFVLIRITLVVLLIPCA
jgi:hypothetical protein